MRGKTVKIIGGSILILLALIVGGYSYVSSGHFIKAHVLPRLARDLGTELHADDAEFSVMNQLVLKNLRMGREADPLLVAGEVRVRYRALALFSNRVEIDEVLIRDVKIAATPEKLEALTLPEQKPVESGKQPALDIKNVKIRNFSLSYVQDDIGAGRMDLQVPLLELDLPELVSGQDFHLTANTMGKAMVGEQVDAEVQNITLDLTGSLGPDVMPTALNLDLNVTEITGHAGPVALDGRRVQLAAELAGNAQRYELKRLELVEYNHDTRDAEISISGELGIELPSAALDLSVAIPSSSLLNVIGAVAGGLEFGQTTVTYEGHVDMPSANRLASRGELTVRDLTVAKPSAGISAMEPLQISATHDLGADLSSKTLILTTLRANVAAGGRNVITAALSEPVSLDLEHPGGDADASLAVQVDRFDLTLLNALLTDQSDLRIVRGEVNRIVNLEISQGGREVVLDVGGGGIDRLIVEQAGNRVGPLRINHEARIRVTDFETLNIDRFKVDLIPLAQGPGPAATLSLAGQLNLAPRPTGTLNLQLDGYGEKLMALAGPPRGDLDLAIGQPVLTGSLALELTGDSTRAMVDFKATGIEAESVTMGMGRTIALDIDSHLQGTLLNGQTVTLESGYVRASGFGRDNLVEVNLGEAGFSLTDLRESPDAVTVPITYAVNDLDLTRLIGFLPPDAGVARMAGRVQLNGNGVLTGRTVKLQTQGRVDAAEFAMRDGTALASPVTSSMDMALDYTVGGQAKIERMNLKLQRSGEPQLLLDLEVTGHFDTGMNPDIQNVISVATHGTVPLDKLQQLIVLPEKRETTPAPSEPPPNVWLAANLSMEKATYQQLVITNLIAHTEYRNGQLELTKGIAGVNDGTINATGNCDLSDPAKPPFHFRINSRDIQFAPVVATLIPGMEVYSRGAIKQGEIEVKGSGFDLASLQENLTANVDVQLDQFAIERLGGITGQLTQAMLLTIFNMNWNDLRFNDGGMKLAIDAAEFDDHNIHIRQVWMEGPVFRFDGSGTVRFGGTWEPRMEIRTGFSQGKASQLRALGFSVADAADADGYYAGPTIPLSGDLTSLPNQARLVSEILLRSGHLSATDARRSRLATDILGIFSGDEQTDTQDAVGSALGGILNEVLEDQTRDGAPGDNQDDTSGIIGNVLEGLFGN